MHELIRHVSEWSVDGVSQMEAWMQTDDAKCCVRDWLHEHESYSDGIERKMLAVFYMFVARGSVFSRDMDDTCMCNAIETFFARCINNTVCANDITAILRTRDQWATKDILKNHAWIADSIRMMRSGASHE